MNKVFKEMEGDNNSSSSSTATGRLRFNIELRPGETTIVSWKKLIKEANSINSNSNGNGNGNKPDLSPPHTVRQKAQEVQVALDEYFQDENPTTKYNEFTMSKGIMEHLNGPMSSPDCQLKKRKKHIPKDLGEKVDDHVPNKPAKSGHARLKAAKNVPVVGQSSSHSQSLGDSSEHYHDRKLQHLLDSPIGFAKIKHDHTSSKSEYSLHSGISNDTSGDFVNSEDTEKQRLGTAQCRNVGNNLKVASEFSGATHQKHVEKIDSKQLERQAKRTLNDTIEHEFPTCALKREKNGSRGLPDLNIPASTIEPVIQEKTRGKKLPTPRTEVTVHGEVSTMARPQTVTAGMIAETNKMIPIAPASDHHLTAPARMSSLMPKSSNTDLSKHEKLERMAHPTLKQQLEIKVSKLSLRSSKESHKRALGQPDGLTHRLAALPLQTEKDRGRTSM